MRISCLALAVITSSVLLPEVAAAAACTATNSITRITNTSPTGLYEYVIFDVKNPSPTYQVASKSPPFTFDPSDDPVAVNGVKFKQILFPSVYWMCTIPELLHLPKTQVKDVKRTGQFEGVVSYVVGYQTASKYVTTYHYAVTSTRSKVIMKFKK
ncbi:hypothetical protein [uncultured Thiothrix sp.]|uniref:AMIN-like domain-containing (lipo)protein n=1 Tax=uncultured Thiothrix sp. TaxID=223185 RepID=UPI002631A030|nr:hypothetical protein [uncultured Thiothrix sp.]